MPEVTIIDGDSQIVVAAAQGANLRRLLLDHGFTPYVALTSRLNCGGRGLCATCGVWIDAYDGADDMPEPQHWHDRIGARFGYPRLSCQVKVDADITVRLVPDKLIWGGPSPDRRWQG